MSLYNKILAHTDLSRISKSAKRPMVFTNGVFDLVHAGHVTYLEQARALGSSLCIGLNSDSSTRQLEKAPDRPINPERDRAILLAALASVDFVASFDEPTPVELIRELRPDIYVKGGDYDIETLEEAHLTRSWGGSAYSLPFLRGYSTTSLIERIRSSES